MMDILTYLNGSSWPDSPIRDFVLGHSVAVHVQQGCVQSTTTNVIDKDLKALHEIKSQKDFVDANIVFNFHVHTFALLPSVMKV